MLPICLEDNGWCPMASSFFSYLSWMLVTYCSLRNPCGAGFICIWWISHATGVLFHSHCLVTSHDEQPGDHSVALVTSSILFHILPCKPGLGVIMLSWAGQLICLNKARTEIHPNAVLHSLWPINWELLWFWDHFFSIDVWHSGVTWHKTSYYGWQFFGALSSRFLEASLSCPFHNL